MLANEYQELAMRTTVPMAHDDCLVLAALGLAGEAGEIVEHVKKYIYHGHQYDRAEMSKEIGDVLWYLTYLANSLDLRLSDIMQQNIEKLAKRYPNGFTHEDSQNREEYRAASGAALSPNDVQLDGVYSVRFRTAVQFQDQLSAPYIQAINALHARVRALQHSTPIG